MQIEAAKRLNKRGTLVVIAILTLSLKCAAAADAPTNQTTKPIVDKGDTVTVGDKLTLVKSKRTISFPAWVNQQQGVIEYALVMRAGKTHESLFATDADARDLHMLALLLDVPSEDILSKGNEAWTISPPSLVKIEAAWKIDGKERKHALGALTVLRDVKNRAADKNFGADAWCYNGSRLIEGGAFLAQTGGSIVSMIFDPDALINNPEPDRTDDDIHFVNAPLVPPVGTPVTITFSYPNKKPGDKAKAASPEKQTPK
jgi:hypothetical protein